MAPGYLPLDNLQKGDLVFQLRTGGELEWIISRLFAGYNGMALNHVALCTGDNKLIEAVMPRVQKTTTELFLRRSVKDGLDRPCVVVARPHSHYQHLINDAIGFAEQQLNLPYNSEYNRHRKAWYCSELVLKAFNHANNGLPVFPETPMGFRDLETGELFNYWETFYKKIGKPIPEGELGSHPALLSCSDKIDIINIVGQLPAKKYSGTDLNQDMQLA